MHDNCELQSSATIGDDAKISENFLVGFGSVFDKYSSALYAARIGSNVCIGNYASVGTNAVVHKYVTVHGGTPIFKDEIIIQTRQWWYILLNVRRY